MEYVDKISKNYYVLHLEKFSGIKVFPSWAESWFWLCLEFCLKLSNKVDSAWKSSVARCCMSGNTPRKTAGISSSRETEVSESHGFSAYSQEEKPISLLGSLTFACHYTPSASTLTHQLVTQSAKSLPGRNPRLKPEEMQSLAQNHSSQ